MPTLADLIASGDVNDSVTFLDQEEKNQLALSGDVFTITRVTYEAKGKFGPMWCFAILLDGEETNLSLTAKARVNGFYRDLEEATKSHPVDGACLKVYDKRMGNLMLQICPPSEWEPWPRPSTTTPESS